MRRFLVFASLVTFILLLSFSCLGFALGNGEIFQPGNALFPLQRFIEQQRLSLAANNTGKALYLLDLADRRIVQLTNAVGSPAELPALIALDEALELADTAVAQAPAADALPLVERLKGVVKRSRAALAALQVAPREALETYTKVQAKVDALRLLLFGQKFAGNTKLSKLRTIMYLPLIPAETNPPLEVAGPVAASIDPQSIQFPSGSLAAQHAFFPLVGEHAQLSCEQCHINGQFAGTASQCAACHANSLPANHFSGECSACHTSVSWADVHFDHKLAGATNCQACHNRPANHFAGQCSACHSTNAWRPANFNHQAAKATDCQSCHNRPANHFGGQCSTCHNTSAWLPASFNHTGLTDCQSCHALPNNHFGGQCSTCHETNSWKSGNFNHEAMGATDCQSCHARPANHFSGQCSTCHNTSAWSSASFNHEGQTDCQSCHARPANHFSGQCSACHNSGAWSPASFNHEGQTDCQSCHARPANHFGGQCSACHNSSAWSPANFNHQGQTDCRACHSPAPDHWGGQCSQCHNTSGWGDVNVSGHSFPINHKDAGGVCSRCHPGNNPGWTCYNCHNKAETEKHHAEKGILDIASRCIECHPNGNDD